MTLHDLKLSGHAGSFEDEEYVLQKMPVNAFPWKDLTVMKCAAAF
jgi:hypothetical protein